MTEAGQTRSIKRSCRSIAESVVAYAWIANSSVGALIWERLTLLRWEHQMWSEMPRTLSSGLVESKSAQFCFLRVRYLQAS